MKPVDVKSNIHINFKEEVSEKDPKFKIDDTVTVPNWSGEAFIITKV